MEEFQEADILWPESMQNPRSFVNWQNYLHFTPSQMSEASLSSASSSSNSTYTQYELQESELSWPGDGDDSYFFSVGNLSEQKICCDEEWQEADVLWPEHESLTRHREFKFAWENCSLIGDEDRFTKREPTRVSSPIDIPKRKINDFVCLL